MALTKQISNRALILSPTTAEVATTQTIAPYYDFRIDGVLELPLGEYFDSGRYIGAAQKFASAKISVRKGGTSEYDITVKSYDSAGNNEITHIEFVGASFTTDNILVTLPFVQNEVPQERSLVFRIRESSSGTPIEDFSLTIVSTVFTELSPSESTSAASIEGPSLINDQAFNLESNRALAITASGVSYASADDVPSAKACIGIATATAAPGGPVTLVASGLAANRITGLGFTAGDAVFLGLNGNLVDEATASGYPLGFAIKQLGFAINSNDLWVQISGTEIIS